MSAGPVHVEQVDPRLEPVLRRWWEVGRDSWLPDRAVDDWPAWDHTRHPSYEEFF